MGIFSTTEFNSLQELFEHELKDLFDAEHRLTEALPKLADKASNPSLKMAFENHLRETEKHVERLEAIFDHIGVDAEREKCDAMVGLIKEGGNVLDAEGDVNVLDAALIAAAQRAEHYEMAAYGSARAFARQLGNEYAAELLEQTLEEEKAADLKLTEIAEGAVNPATAR
jgi:ferritin-like metal-binding protein YciE